MKNKINKIVVPIFLAVFCGFLCGRLMFSIYEEKGSSVLDSNIIYLLEDSTYNNYEEMKANTLSSNYIYYEDDGKYNVVVALTKDYDNIEKIENVYNKELKVSRYLLNNNEIISKLDEYDRKLKETTSSEEIRNIIIDMINIYKDKEDIKMAKIS